MGALRKPNTFQVVKAKPRPANLAAVEEAMDGVAEALTRMPDEATRKRAARRVMHRGLLLMAAEHGNQAAGVYAASFGGRIIGNGRVKRG